MLKCFKQSACTEKKDKWRRRRGGGAASVHLVRIKNCFVMFEDFHLTFLHVFVSPHSSATSPFLVSAHAHINLNIMRFYST